MIESRWRPAHAGAGRSTSMKSAREDTILVAMVWLAMIGFVVVVCVLLPTPPPASDPRFVSVLLDFFFGAIAVALASGIAAVFCAFRFVQRLRREIEARDERLRRDFGHGK
jgi:TRAP-type C4-dicarboxylate transport system permease small subunit